VGTRVWPRGCRSYARAWLERRQVSGSSDGTFHTVTFRTLSSRLLILRSCARHQWRRSHIRENHWPAAICYAREQSRDDTATTMGLEISFADLHDTTTFFSGNYDVSSVFVTIGCALSIYNGLELLLLVFTTFRRFQGLYFWSLLTASFGLLPYTIGLMIMYFTFINSRTFCLPLARLGASQRS
jgi:hypothetical protein